MVERSSDITDITTGKPKKFDMFDRVDMALRRIPGSGVFGAWAMLGLWRPPDDSMLRFGFWLLNLVLIVVAVIALVEEFWPHAFGARHFTSAPARTSPRPPTV